MSVFSSPTGSPGCPDLVQTFPMSLSDDVREDALHDLLERIDIREGLVSLNPWSGRETELRQWRTQSFINSLETQTQQPSSQEDPDATEQRVQHEPGSHHVSIDTTPQVHHFTDDSRCHRTQGHNREKILHLLPISQLQYFLSGRTMTKFVFLPKYIWWSHGSRYKWQNKNWYVLNLVQSRLRGHIWSLWIRGTWNVWHQPYIMEQVELYCEPICNFHAARYKFWQVTQREHEMTNAFYHRIQKCCVQCQFSDDEECLVDAIIYGTRVHRAREKLLQMPNTSPCKIV